MNFSRRGWFGRCDIPFLFGPPLPSSLYRLDGEDEDGDGTKPEEHVKPSAASAPAELEGAAATRYECMVCGYIYDLRMGDAAQHIPPGTPFDQLPDEWICPHCHVTRKMFIPQGEIAPEEQFSQSIKPDWASTQDSSTH